MDDLPQNIDRRDFLKLKSLLVIWLYFLQSFGINILAKESSKIDYSLLDKLQKLTFSKDVKEELDLRIYLQKKYCYDGNGKLHNLNRFIKEITNFIVSKKDFNDFKQLNSIKDDQIDLVYMLNSTAKHNELNSMKYLQKKLLTNEHSNILSQALEYAIKSQSFDTTIHLMKQKIKLDTKTQTSIINSLRKEEYENFYKKISNKSFLKLPTKSKTIQKRYIVKKYQQYNFTDLDILTLDFEEALFNIVYNSVAQLYMNYTIDDFDISLDKKKVSLNIRKEDRIYPINFISIFGDMLKAHGYDGFCNNFSKDASMDFETMMRIRNLSDSEVYTFYRLDIDRYSFIDIDVL